jgi:flavorubredoxin
MKVLVIYDSKGGNTEKMAQAIAQGAASVEGVETEAKKIGEPFPLTMLAEADAVAFGSPVIYADVTDEMRGFLEHVRRYVDAGKMEVKDRRAAVFGSYGYDGAWIMEERLKKMVEDIGYDVQDKVCVEIDSNLRHHPADPLRNCRAFGKEIAESLTE